MSATARTWLQRIRDLPAQGRTRILNVCGGHERSIAMAGLRGALPAHVELLPGPGCPVCVCPEEDVYAAIRVAMRHEVTLAAFGDLLRVPVNVPKSEPRSLEQARAAGADVRAIASPLDAVELAAAHPRRTVVLFAAGFETTMAPVAAMLAAGVPDNLLVLLSGRRTWPAVALLLDSSTPGFEALVAPGHVATIMGPEEWNFVVEQHQLPAAVAGFSADSLLAAFYSTIRQRVERHAFLDNCYPEVARPGGNPAARKRLKQVFDVVDAQWRGIGVIPESGYTLNSTYAQHDARNQLEIDLDNQRKRAGEMPPGCDCARVVLGKIYPDQCRLYGRGCNPRHPIGPCMVSDEGACRIWWASGVRTPAPLPDQETG